MSGTYFDYSFLVIFTYILSLLYVLHIAEHTFHLRSSHIFMCNFLKFLEHFRTETAVAFYSPSGGVKNEI